jgi:sulfite reductase beta subunit-like hemoprotein
MCPSPDAGSPAATPPRPADRCPGILRLHPAADGHLVRVRLPGGIVGPTGLRAVAALAVRGTDVVESTSRTGLQVRGLPVDGATAAADLLRQAGLLPSLAHDRVRNILAAPLGGRGAGALMRTDALVTGLDAAICADPRLADLPGRFLFRVEDGSGTAGPQRADVTLAATPDGRLRLWLAGEPTTLHASPADAPALATDAARAFLDLQAEAATQAWRITDLDDGPQRVARALGGSLVNTPAPPLRAASTGPGVHHQADGRAGVTAVVPLGRLDAATLLGLAARVDALPGTSLRIGVDRTVSVVDVPGDQTAGLVAALAALGLIAEPGSGWERLSACAGLGACARARADVRGAATRRAAARRGGGARPEHWAACERGCGRPAGDAVVVTAAADGVRVQRAGRVDDLDGIPAALAALAAGA